MHSLSKTTISLNTAQAIVAGAFGSASRIRTFDELTDGFFNAAYALTLADGLRCVLKVAPPDAVCVLRYERDILAAEVAVMRLLRARTSIPTQDQEKWARGGSILFNSAQAAGSTELVGRTPNQITRLGIARTFQNIRLFRDMTVLDNVRTAHYSLVGYSPVEALFHAGRYGAEERRITENAMDLLATFKLDGLADEQAKNLPYGSQRRLEIARALATRPKLLLLDEPAAGMNPKEIIQLMEFIQWVRREFDLTIILIEHQMRLVMGICERIKVLDFGATIAEGLPQEIQSNPKVLEAYLGEETMG